MSSVKLPIVLSGEVVFFSGNGRKLGYPTANIRISKLLPEGVYFGYTNLDIYSDWPSIIFIGVPKTVGDKQSRLEAHLLDIPDKDYYGKTLGVKICKHWRGNKKFNSKSELIQAMNADKKMARKWFSGHTV